MVLVLVKIDAGGVRRYLPRFSSIMPLTAEQLERQSTTQLKQAQLFNAKPVSLSGQTMLCLEPTPPPGLEDFQVWAVAPWLTRQDALLQPGGHEDAHT
jgi:hypothetical protein